MSSKTASETRFIMFRGRRVLPVGGKLQLGARRGDTGWHDLPSVACDAESEPLRAIHDCHDCHTSFKEVGKKSTEHSNYP